MEQSTIVLINLYLNIILIFSIGCNFKGVYRYQEMSGIMINEYLFIPRRVTNIIPVAKGNTKNETIENEFLQL